ncbi:hypothetical protein BAE44_0009732, partial [Dichanthelium oligosanthes]
MPSPAPPLPPLPAGVVPLSVSESGTPHSVTGPDEQDIVSVGNDGDAEHDRTARRLNWTKVEELRLVSAWLNSSRLSYSKKNGCFQSEKIQLMDKTWAMYNEEAREMDCTSSSEDAEDAPEIETESQEDIQCSVDPQHMIEKNHKEMREAELQCSNQKLKLARSNQLEMKEEEMQGSTVREDVPEKKTHSQGHKTTMLQKDREKMSEVHLRLSKEKLELARLKQQEVKDRKETTLYEKYTELLMADTQRFDEFQKEEHRKA